MTRDDADATALQEAEDLDTTDFIARENARERGEAVGPAPAPPEVEPPSPPRDEPPRAPTPPIEPPRPAARSARHDRQARVQEAVARQRQAERERDEARAQLAAWQQPSPPPGAPPATADQEPTLQQFAGEPDPYTSYILARSDYQNRQRYQQYQQQQQQIQADQNNRAWAGQLKAGLDGQWQRYRQEHPDFESQLDPEVTGTLRYHGLMPDGSLDRGTQLGNLVAVSGLAPQLLSYFSTHKAEFQRIQSLEPPDHERMSETSVAKRILLGVEFGRVLERVLGSNGNRQPVSQARPPIRRPSPVPGPGTSEDSGDDTDMSETAILRHIRDGNAAEGRSRGIRRRR